MIEINSIEDLNQEKSNFLAEMESLIDEQIFVDKIESFTLAANEYIEQLEAENAALRAKLSKSEEARQTAQIYLDDAKEHCRNEVQNLRHKLSGYINKVANLEQKLEQSEKRLGLFLEGDTCLIYSGIDKKWFVHYEDELEIYSIGSGLTKIEAIDAAIAKEKENA